jgi:hypothetical protein
MQTVAERLPVRADNTQIEPTGECKQTGSAARKDDDEAVESKIPFRFEEKKQQAIYDAPSTKFNVELMA